MKLKKSVIITFFIIIFGFLSFIYLKNNKDITYKSVISDSKNYLISYRNGENKNWCDKYYDGEGTVIYRYTEVEEGYPMYIYNNCAVELNYYLEQTEDDVNACETQKEWAEKHIESDRIIDEYNSDCEGITGKLITNYDGKTCVEAKNDIKNYPIDNSGLYIWYNNNCIDETGEINIAEINKNDYNLQGNDCERKRLINSSATTFEEIGVTGILKSKNIDVRNDCEYPLYYVNGYATTFDDYKAKTGWLGEQNVKNECDKLSEDVLTDYSKYYSDYYTLCVKHDISDPIYAVEDVIDVDEINSTKTSSCDAYFSEYSNKSLILRTKYDGYVYIVNGCAWAYDDIVRYSGGIHNINDEFKTKVCENRREELLSRTSNSQDVIDTFNKSCGSYGYKLEYVDVIFDAGSSSGLECNESKESDYRVIDIGYNRCLYRYTINNTSVYLNSSELPDTSEVIQYMTTYSFNGWSLNGGACQRGNLSYTLPDFNNSLVFNACFDENSDVEGQSYKIYSNCNGTGIKSGSYKSNGALRYSSINGSEDVDNKGMLKNEITTKKYYMPADDKTTKTTYAEGGNDHSFRLNKYCFVSCTEFLEYSYPSIFSTVKSGTYFKLLNYPDIVSKFYCEESIQEQKWELDYEKAIDAEGSAYVDDLNKNLISNLSPSTYQCCSGTGRNRTCWYGEKYTLSQIYVYNSVRNEVQLTRRVFSENTCGGKTGAQIKANMKNSIVRGLNYSQAKKNREDLEESLKDCTNALSTTTSENFYNLNGTTAQFKYQNGEKVNGIEEWIIYDLRLKKSYSSDTNLKNGDEPINQEVSLDYETKELYKDQNGIQQYGTKYYLVDSDNEKSVWFYRQVDVRYTFEHNITQPYYAEAHTGNITTSASTNSIHLGYVYPVPLTSSGSKNVQFIMNINSNIKYGAAKFVENEEYSCTYNISNDIVIKDNEEGESDSFKKNFYVRSIATDNVDPNDRYENGTLGANWASEKGKKLKAIIESKSNGKNTYNPSNLEYSFTLNAQTIDAIREYNNDKNENEQGYDDFNMSCNDMGGECKSDFLDSLKAGKLNGENIYNVNALLDRSSWKYYINGQWVKTSSIEQINQSQWKVIDAINNSTQPNMNSFKNCLSASNYDTVKKKYDCIYKNVNEGVLP